MGKRELALGQAGEIQITPQRRDEVGRWKTHPTGKGKGVERWRARAYYRGHDGILADVTRVAARRPEAVAACERALTERLRIGSGQASPNMALIAAGRAWLALIERNDSGLSARTVSDYSKTFTRYIDTSGSSLRGLTLEQANDPARLRGFLQNIADRHGTGAAKIAKSVLSGILGQAVNDGVLATNATRQVRPVKAQGAPQGGAGRRREERDTTRALTRSERSAVIAFADELAAEGNVIERTKAKHQAAADLTALMAGTGVRVSEARALRWEHLDLGAGTVDIHGTKSKGSKRRLSLPAWLWERLERRREQTGGTGYVFAAPSAGDSERMWDQSNCADALAGILSGAGFPWATPHTYRRTVATLLSEAGLPIARIADQLGHADPAMTASVYLGRDFDGDKSDLAAAL